MKQKKNAGITLIALVITIVVLLILAGISIYAIFGDNGILSKAKESTEKYELESEKERLELVRIDTFGKNNGIVTVENYLEELILQKIISENDIIENTDGSRTFTTDRGYIVTIRPNTDKNIIIEVAGEANTDKDRIPTAVGNLEFKNLIWNNGKASISISKITQNNFKMQYKVNAGEYQSIEENEKTLQNLNYNDTITARFWNGNQGGKEVTYTITDTIEPSNFKIEATNITTGGFKLAVSNAQDNESGIEKYEFYIDNSLEKTITTNLGTAEYEKTGATTGKTYSCYVIAYDKAGNSKKSETITVKTISYVNSVNATAYRGQNGSIYEIAIEGANIGYVWGTDIYTDDSNIARAAVHAGLVAIGQQKIVKIKILAGQSSYTGTTRNGITTSDYASWPGSYQFVK